MVALAVYNGKDGSFVDDMSNSVVNLWFTIGLNGIASGTVLIEDTPEVHTVLEDFRENSHFLKFGLDTIYGGVVESASLEAGVWTVTFVGAAGWWDKMPALSSQFMDGAVEEDSNIGVAVFYAESPVGILYEVFKNQAEVMDNDGWYSSVIDYSGLASKIEAVGYGSFWERSYRLNSFETPTFASVVNNILEGLDNNENFFFSVSVDADISSSSTFSFVVDIVDASEVDYFYYIVDEDDIFDVKVDRSGSQYRNFGIASGTNLQGEKDLKRYFSTNDEGAYSGAIAMNSREASNAIRSLAKAEVTRANASVGSMNFSKFEDDIPLFSVVDIYRYDNNWNQIQMGTGTIVEVVVDGNRVTYSVDLNLLPSAASLKNAPSVERNLIFEPLNEALGLSGTVARRSNNSTGWRN